MRVGSSKVAIFAYFTRHIFRTFTSKATIIILRYVVLRGSSMTPKYMTLNDLECPFCVKIYFGLGNYWVGVSGCRTKLLENLQSYPCTLLSATKM